MTDVPARALDLIRRWEGLRLRAYQDAVGIWTIGYGHTATARSGQTITRDEAETLLRRDATAAAEAVDRLVTVDLNEPQRAALISFTFNVGATALGKSTLLRKLNGGDPGAVPEELGRWVYAKGKRLKGLVDRRRDEARLWSAQPGLLPDFAGPPPDPDLPRAARPEEGPPTLHLSDADLARDAGAPAPAAARPAPRRAPGMR